MYVIMCQSHTGRWGIGKVSEQGGRVCAESSALSTRDQGTVFLRAPGVLEGEPSGEQSLALFPFQA